MTGLKLVFPFFLEYSLQVLVNLKHNDYLRSIYTLLLLRLVFLLYC